MNPSDAKELQRGFEKLTSPKSSIDDRVAACSELADLSCGNAAVTDALAESPHIAVFCQLIEQTKQSANPERAKGTVLLAIQNVAVTPKGTAAVMKSWPLIYKEWLASMKNPGNDGTMLRRMFSIIHNLSTDDIQIVEMRKHNIVDPCLTLLKHPDVRLHIRATMTLANLVGHIENHPLLEADTNIVKELVVVLEHCLRGEFYADSKWLLWCPLQCLANLSLNEKNKLLIVDSIVPSLVLQLFQQFPTESRAIEYATRMLANLAFVSDFAARLPAFNDKLQYLASSGSTTAIREKALIALFQLAQRRKKPEAPSTAFTTDVKQTDKTSGHIMLSYPWKYQELFLWLKKYFEGQGYTVWMDVDQMSSSVLDAMASAVENSSVVIYCLSSAYKESEACRTEGEYAYNLRKPMIPVKPDASYRPDGWLGALTGNKLYFQFDNPSSYESKVKELEKEVSRYGVGKRGSLAPSTGVRGGSDSDISRKLAAAEARIKELEAKLQARGGGGSDADRIARLEGMQEQLLQRLDAHMTRIGRSRGGCNIL